MSAKYRLKKLEKNGMGDLMTIVRQPEESDAEFSARAEKEKKELEGRYKTIVVMNLNLSGKRD